MKSGSSSFSHDKSISTIVFGVSTMESSRMTTELSIKLWLVLGSETSILRVFSWVASLMSSRGGRFNVNLVAPPSSLGLKLDSNNRSKYQLNYFSMKCEVQYSFFDVRMGLRGDILVGYHIYCRPEKWSIRICCEVNIYLQLAMKFRICIVYNKWKLCPWKQIQCIHKWNEA